MSISNLAISARGKGPKKAVAREPRRPGAGTLWRRISDNWEQLEALGANPDLGTVIGRLFLFGELSHTEASAARLYAEIYGRYARHHGLARETAASPAYERGFGREDEVERHTRTNTLASYEKRAKRAKKAWDKLQKYIPPGARDILREVTILNRDVPQPLYPDLRAVLGNIAKGFHIAPPGPVAAMSPRVVRTDAEKRVRLAVGSLASWFRENHGEIRTFRLLGAASPDGMRGIEGFGFGRADARPLKHALWVSTRDTLKETIDALFLRLCAEVGWKEVTP